MIKIVCAALVAIGSFALLRYFHVTPAITEYLVCGLASLFALALMK